MKKINILFIVPSLKRAGAETQVVDLVNSLDNNKFKIYLFAFLENNEQVSRLGPSIKYLNIPRRNKIDLRVMKGISKIIDEEKIDIVHCTLQFSLLMGWLGVKLTKRKPKLIAAIHTTKNISLKNELADRLLYQYILRACKSVIFVSRKQRDFWVSKYPFLNDKSTVIYNGVDTSYFDPEKFRNKRKAIRQSLSIPDDAKVIACIAAFRKEKAHDILIDAFSHLNSNTYLLLAGDGVTKSKIVNLVHEKRIKERVRFLGSIEDVRPILAISDVSVLASTAVETFSIAMLESMSMEVPVVATNIGVLSEAIIENVTGRLVVPGNSKMLTQTIDSILKEVTFRPDIIKICRKFIINNFSKDKMIYQTEKLLCSVYEKN